LLAGEGAENHIACDLFVDTDGVEAVGAGQVEDTELSAGRASSVALLCGLR
jgi:hypothetical protein